MAQEALLKVKEAEDKCADMINSASDKSKAILDKAQADGEEKYKAIIAQANKLRLELVEQAEDEARAQCEAIASGGEANLEKIKNPADAEFSKVVSLVMERIVNTHGNS